MQIIIFYNTISKVYTTVGGVLQEIILCCCDSFLANIGHNVRFIEKKFGVIEFFCTFASIGKK